MAEHGARGAVALHLTEALERVMMAGGGSAAARQRERFAALEKGMRALEGRVDSLEKEVRGGLGEIREAVEEAGQGTVRRGTAQGACPQGRHRWSAAAAGPGWTQSL